MANAALRGIGDAMQSFGGVWLGYEQDKAEQARRDQERAAEQEFLLHLEGLRDAREDARANRDRGWQVEDRDLAHTRRSAERTEDRGWQVEDRDLAHTRRSAERDQEFARTEATARAAARGATRGRLEALGGGSSDDPALPRAFKAYVGELAEEGLDRDGAAANLRRNLRNFQQDYPDLDLSKVGTLLDSVFGRPPAQDDLDALLGEAGGAAEASAGGDIALPREPRYRPANPRVGQPPLTRGGRGGGPGARGAGAGPVGQTPVTSGGARDMLQRGRPPASTALPYDPRTPAPVAPLAGAGGGASPDLQRTLEDLTRLAETSQDPDERAWARAEGLRLIQQARGGGR